ncbi:hypothetical protein [Kitasatospora cinereorecta]|uniref:Tetratricopeptide repeat protein n=1 Tax=Kitasatospora cinereorecta TaxID=285560 RepID=A0ABW0VGQ0_9ACTN
MTIPPIPAQSPGSSGEAPAEPAEAAPELRALLVRLRDRAGDAPGPDGAAHLLELVAREMTALLGRYDRETLVAWRELGFARREAGDPAAAVHLLGQVVADMAQALGPADRDTLYAHLEFAAAMGDAGDPGGAAQRLRDLVPSLTAEVGPQGDLALTAQVQLAVNLGRIGDLMGAVGQLLQLLPAIEQGLGEQSRALADARTGLGRLVVPWRRVAGGGGLPPVMAVAMVHRLIVWDFGSDAEADAYLTELERATGRKGLAGRLAAVPDGMTAAQATAMVLG